MVSEDVHAEETARSGLGDELDRSACVAVDDGPGYEVEWEEPRFDLEPARSGFRLGEAGPCELRCCERDVW